MKALSQLPSMGRPIVVTGCLIVIVLGGGIVVGGNAWFFDNQAAFAGASPAGKAQPGEMQPSDGKKDKDCQEDPVACQGTALANNPVPGCTSGQSCTTATAGKPCGMIGSGNVCQTVNNGSGVCACLCKRVQ